MAERIVKWLLLDCVLKMAQVVGENKVEIKAEFDLSKIYPTFATFNDTQKQIIAYGIKQKLSDKGANSIADFGGKCQVAKQKYDELVAGKWSGERANATGDAEVKSAVKAIKAERANYSVEQLKAMKTLGFKLTAEEEAKIAE